MNEIEKKAWSTTAAFAVIVFVLIFILKPVIDIIDAEVPGMGLAFILVSAGAPWVLFGMDVMK